MVDLTARSEASRTVHATGMLVGHLLPAIAAGPDRWDGVSAHCIEAARTVQAALRQLGLPARLLPVDMTVENSEARQLRQTGVPLADWPPGAWRLGVVHDGQDRSPAGGWNGHLIVDVGRTWLVDASAGGLSRPGRLAMPVSITLPYPKDVWDADVDGWATLAVSTPQAPTAAHPRFVWIELRRRPDNTGWKAGSAGSVDVRPVADLVAGLVERLRAGTLPEAVTIETGLHGPFDLELASVIRRYRSG